MKLFIVGSGRTGTHLLSEIISSNPENNIEVVGESSPLFYPSVLYCMKHSDYYNFLPKLITFFENKNQFVCKFHPLLWIVEKLNDQLEDAYFIGTTRNKPDTIKSMLRHEGIKQWYKTEYTEKLEFPNQFLGLQSREEIINQPMEKLLEKRYISHVNEVKRLYFVLDNFHIFDYDGLYKNIDSEIKKLEDFTGLNGFTCPELKERYFDNIEP